MKIKNRLFPYPVLSSETDDYVNGLDGFQITPSVKENTHELLLSYELSISCDALDKLIREGAAMFVLHLECSSTAFRIALKSETTQIEYRLPKANVNGEINQVAMIIAQKDIPNYSSNDLNEDYSGMAFSFVRGQILAYENLPSIFVSKKMEELKNTDAFFTVIKRVGLDTEEVLPLVFNLRSNKIQIHVDQRTYEAFVNYQGTISIAKALLVQPALIYMIMEVGADPEAYVQFEWYQRLDKYYRSIKMDFVSDVLQKDENPVMIAQEMLQNPISIAYRDLVEIGG